MALSSLSKDILAFLNSYPDGDSSDIDTNFRFYSNVHPGLPSVFTIDQLLDELDGNFEELENNHGFIQWLFPIREMGMNWRAVPLQPSEITLITSSPACMARYKRSYEVILHFYGFLCVDFSTGQLARNDAAGWKSRYQNLSRNSHNWLRITRILKCNSELGKEHWNGAFLLYILIEQQQGYLNKSSLVRSMDTYWMWCIRNVPDRQYVVSVIKSVRNGAEWTETDYVNALERKKRTGTFQD